jgi:hypothetical protein
MGTTNPRVMRFAPPIPLQPMHLKAAVRRGVPRAAPFSANPYSPAATGGGSLGYNQNLPPTAGARHNTGLVSGDIQWGRFVHACEMIKGRTRPDLIDCGFLRI